MISNYLKDCQVLDLKKGYLTNNQYEDVIYLLGKPSKDSPFITNIKIIIEDYQRNIYEINPKENSGYHPTITIDNFTGQNYSILLSIDSGGSGGFGYYYIYDFQNNNFKTIFDNESFDMIYKYTVDYLDNFQVLVICKNLDKQYIVDIKNKGVDYLNNIYFESGKLKKPIQGFVSGVNTLYPLDIERDGKMDIIIIQRIAGLYNADGLGLMATVMRYCNISGNFKSDSNSQYLIIW